MNIYAVKFKYDSGSEIGDEVCLVMAETKDEAKRKFGENIYKIFTWNDDICEILEIRRVIDPELIYLQRGTLWAVLNPEKPERVIW